MVAACFALPLRDREPAGAGRREPARRSGCSACSRPRSGCRSSRSPPTARCCRPGSRAPATRPPKDPYFLYAASNVGSFLALISYPLVVEPFVRLGDQTWLWTVGFYVLIVLIAALRRAAVALAATELPEPPATPRPKRAPPSLARRRDLDRARRGAVRACWSPSRRTSRPTSRRCRCSGSCRWRSIC